MAKVTVIASAEQAAYRIEHLQGCGAEASVDYRVEDMLGEVMIFGELAEEFGFARDQVGISVEDKAAIVELMDGIHPVTKEVIGAPVLRVHPDAKLRAEPLVEAIRARVLVAAGEGSGPTQLSGMPAKHAKLWERLERGVNAKGGAYYVSVQTLEEMAAAAKIDMSTVYSAGSLEKARAAKDERIDIRVKGLDFTFEVDKSVSIAMALDPRRDQIEQSMRALVKEFAAELEAKYGRGVIGHHGDGKERQEIAAKGMFFFATVDPVSREGDPHWHVHMTMPNEILDVNGQWRALSRGGDDLHKNMAAEAASLKSRSRWMLHDEYGYGFENRVINRARTTAWRVAGVTEDDIRATSTRSRKLDEYAQKTYGLAWDQLTPKQQDAARNVTRPGKESEGHVEGLNDLAGFTRRQLLDAGLSAEIDPTIQSEQTNWDASWQEQVAAAAEAILREATQKTATFRLTDARRIALDALPGLPADQQVQLVAEAMNHSGITSMEVLASKLARETAAETETPINTAKWRGVYTTTDVVTAETRLTEILTTTANVKAGITSAQVDRSLARFEAEVKFTLSAEQRKAVHTLTTGRGMVASMSGAAGTGKTTVMAAVKAVYEDAGLNIQGCTAAANAATVLGFESGIRSTTIAARIGVRHGDAYLNASTDPTLDKAKVLVVDEAGMVDRRDLVKLLRVAQKKNQRVLVIGDDKQLPAIGATGGFTTIHKSASTRGAGAVLTEVRRQRNNHEKQALAQFRQGQYEAAVAKYVQAGQVHVTDTRSEALQLAAAMYRKATEGVDPLDRQKKAALVTARNDDAQATGYLAREAARASGQLTGPDVRYNTPGGWIDLAQGELVHLKKNQLIITGDGERTKLLNGRKAVIEEIADDGDLLLRWRNPDGSQQRAYVTRQDVEEDGSIVPGYINQGQMLHGAAGSTHSTQGATVERTILLGAAIDNANLAYVALSRDKDRVDLILDIESLAATPEEAKWMRSLSPERRVKEAAARWVADVVANGEIDQRTLTERILGINEPQQPNIKRPSWIDAGEEELAADLDAGTLTANEQVQAATDATPPPAASAQQEIDFAAGETSAPAVEHAPESVADRAAVLAALRDAHDFYTAQATESWVPGYLQGRGLTATAPLYAPGGWTTLLDHLHARGYSDDTLRAAGLVTRVQSGPRTGQLRDFNVDRLMFPVYNAAGELVAFHGRINPATPDAGPKYLNPPDTLVYRKREHPYGLNPTTIEQLRDGADIVFVEGPADAEAIRAADPTVVAIAVGGTALTDEHLNTLAQIAPLDEREIVSGYDDDTAGQAATLKTFDVLQAAGLNGTAVTYETGQDPAWLLEHRGAETLAAHLADRHPLLDNVVDHAVASALPADYDTSTDETRIHYQWQALRNAAQVATRDIDGELRPAEEILREQKRLIQTLDLLQPTDVSFAVTEAMVPSADFPDIETDPAEEEVTQVRTEAAADNEAAEPESLARGERITLGGQLWEAWDHLAELETEIEELREQLPAAQAEQAHAAELAPRIEHAAALNTAAEHAATVAQERATQFAAAKDRFTAAMQKAWAVEAPAVATAAQTIQQGTGRFGSGKADVQAAQAVIDQWVQRWREVIPVDVVQNVTAYAYAANNIKIDGYINTKADQLAREQVPDHEHAQQERERARAEATAARRALMGNRATMPKTDAADRLLEEIERLNGDVAAVQAAIDRAAEQLSRDPRWSIEQEQTLYNGSRIRRAVSYDDQAAAAEAARHEYYQQTHDRDIDHGPNMGR